MKTITFLVQKGSAYPGYTAEYPDDVADELIASKVAEEYTIPQPTPTKATKEEK